MALQEFAKSARFYPEVRTFRIESTFIALVKYRTLSLTCKCATTCVPSAHGYHAAALWLLKTF
jgi:hypothetical protein